MSATTVRGAYYAAYAAVRAGASVRGGGAPSAAAVTAYNLRRGAAVALAYGGTARPATVLAVARAAAAVPYYAGAPGVRRAALGYSPNAVARAARFLASRYNYVTAVALARPR